MLARYESVAEFARVAETKPFSFSMGFDWYGSITHKEAVKFAISGDDSYVSEADKLIDKLDSSIEINTSRWEASMYGAYPIVPEFLAGSPTPMRTRVMVAEESAPISIYVSTTCSAGLDSKTMLKRGTAILALLLKMQAIRPIELYLLSETHGRIDGEYIQVIKIESKPLNVGVAAFALCHVGFARRLCYGVAESMDHFNGTWPKDYHRDWQPHIREVVGMNDIDLYIPAATSWDTMIKDPIAWVNAQVKRFVGELES